MDFLPYAEMKKRARAFYASLGVALPDRDLSLAVQSLTLPAYARDFREEKIFDNSSLATVGDSFLDAYLLRRMFLPHLSADELSDRLHGAADRGWKGLTTNATLNKIGRSLLGGKLYDRPGDLPPAGKPAGKNKAYATSVEAVIGFLSIVDASAAVRLIEKIYTPVI